MNNSSDSNDVKAVLNAINETNIQIEFSPAGEILTVNKNFVDLFNIRKEEIIGKHHDELLFKEDKIAAENTSFWEDLLKGKPNKDEFRRKGKGNDELFVKGTYIPIKNNEEIVTKVNLIGYNITDTKKALKSLEDLKYALYQSAIVAITDKTGKITYVNDKFTEISKYPKEELLGQDHRILNSGHHSSDFIKNIWKTIANGNVWRGEIKNKAKDNSFYWVDTTIIPFLNAKGKPFQYIALRYDITFRKEIESSLEKAKTQAEQSSKAKESFLANMSHEIRTPLNAIIGFTSLLKEKSLDIDSSKYVKAVSIASKNLLGLINDILDISKIEEGQIELEKRPMNIKMLVQDIVTLNSHVAKSKDIKLITSIDNEIPEFVLGDATRLTQIIVNLMGNALKFTPKGRVELKVLTTQIDAKSATISFAIIDTGIGIPKNKQEKIFDRFTQAEESTTREFGGTGLGLNIVKKLVALFGSEINLRSAIGQGTEFSFEIKFPIIQASEIAKSEIQNKIIGSAPLDSLKILVAEDNPFNQILASTYITRNKGIPEIAENGEVAIEMIQKNDYDCVLMDLQMPKMDGFKTTEFIRKELAIDIPIIACTAHSLVQEKNKSLNYGMNDYITKPYLEAALINTILKYAKKRNAVSQPEKETLKLDDFKSLLSSFEIKMGSEIFNSMLDIFKTRLPEDISDIELAYENENTKLLKDKAHLIAGTLGSFGFVEGFKLAKHIENNVGKNTLIEMKPKLNQLIAYLNEALGAVNTL